MTKASRSRSAQKAWVTRRTPKHKADKTERGSKEKLREWCGKNGWKVLFFEGKTGAPCTGIVDAIIARIRPEDADSIEIRLVQLQAGGSGLTASEVIRIEQAVGKVTTD